MNAHMKLWLRGALALCVSVSLLTGTMQASFLSSLSSYWSSLSSNQRKLVVGVGVGIVGGAVIWKKYSNNKKPTTDNAKNGGAAMQAPVLSAVSTNVGAGGHQQSNEAQGGNRGVLSVNARSASFLGLASSDTSTSASSQSTSTPKRESERKQEKDEVLDKAPLVVTPGEAPYFGTPINFAVLDQGKNNNNCGFHAVRNGIWFVEHVLGKKPGAISDKERAARIEEDRAYAKQNWGRPDNLDDGQLSLFAQRLKMKPATFTIINSPQEKNFEQFADEDLRKLYRIGFDLETKPGMHHIFFLNNARVNERTGHAGGGHWVTGIVHNDNGVIKLHWGDSHLIDGNVATTLTLRKDMFEGLEWFLSKEFRDQVDQLGLIKEGLNKSYSIMNSRASRDLDLIRRLRNKYGNSVNRSSDVRAFLVSVGDRIDKDIYLNENERKTHQGLCASLIEPMDKENKSNKASGSIDKDLAGIASEIEKYYATTRAQLSRMLGDFEQIPQLLQIGAAKILVSNNEVTITSLLGRLELLIEQDPTIPQLIKDRLEAVKKEFASVTATEQILQQVQRVRAKSK